MLKKIISNTSSNYALKFIQVLLNVISVPVLINKMGSEGFGILLFANVLVGYFGILDLGISQGLTKFVAEYSAKRDSETVKSVINTSLSFYFLIGLIVFSCVLLFVRNDGITLFNISKSNHDAANIVFLLAGVLALFAWPKLAMEGAFRGIQEFPILNFTIGIGRIISVALAITLAYLKAPLEYIFLAFNADKMALFFWQYYLLKRRIPFWGFETKSVSTQTFRRIFSFSGWIMLGQIAVILEYQFDQLILAGMVSVAAIATYTVVFFLFSVIQQVSGLAASAVMPAVAETKAHGDHRTVDDFLLYGAKYHNALFVPIVITCYYLAEPFIRLWVGSDYLQFVWLVQASVLFQLLWQSNAFLGQVYTGIGKSKKTGLVAILSGIINVSLSIVLVSYYGLPGVILGTLIAGAISVPLIYVYIVPDFEISRASYFRKVFLEAQMPILLVGLCLYPLHGVFNDLSSWLALISVSTSLLICLYAFCFVFVLEQGHRSKLVATVSSIVKRIFEGKESV